MKITILKASHRQRKGFLPQTNPQSRFSLHRLYIFRYSSHTLQFQSQRSLHPPQGILCRTESITMSNTEQKYHVPVFLNNTDSIERFADVTQEFLAGLTGPNFKMSVCGAITSPSSFFIIPMDFWAVENVIMADLQDYGVDMTEDDMMDSRPTSADLVKGSYVTHFFMKEWHRGRIIDINPQSERPYLVRLIDFGDAVEASLSELRLLFRKCKEYEPAVECQLVLPLRNNGSIRRRARVRTHWELSQVQAFRKIIFDRSFEVTLLRKVKNTYGETVWQVTINIPEQTGNPVEDVKLYGNGTTTIPDSIGDSERILRKYTIHDIHSELEAALHTS